MSFWFPKRRYSAVALFSQDLDHVLLIHKQKPAWQAGKANFPGGKVEESDHPSQCNSPDDASGCTCNLMLYRNCAHRELLEETGLDIPAAQLQLFCKLRYKAREGDTAECYFFAAVGQVFDAKTKEAEHVFPCDTVEVAEGNASYSWWSNQAMSLETETLPTMPNLPYLVTMAQQCLRSEGAGPWPLTIYESSVTP